MAAYLFPSIMYNRLHEVVKHYHSEIKLELPQDELHHYQLVTRQYLGLGGLLQFIPGTAAFRARQIFSAQLQPVLQAGTEQLEASESNGGHVRNTERLRKKGMALQLNSLINLSPGYFFLREFFLSFRFDESAAHTGYPFQELFCQLPLVRDCLGYQEKTFRLKDDFKKLLFLSLRNPFRIIDNTLDFLHIAAFYIIETGDKPHIGGNSSPVRKGFKAVASFIFAFLRAPVKIGKFLVDGGYQLLKHLIYSPLEHVALSCFSSQQPSTETIAPPKESTSEIMQELGSNVTAPQERSTHSDGAEINYSGSHKLENTGQPIVENEREPTVFSPSSCK